MLDQLTIDKIRDTAQILDVVGEFVSLRRRGQNYIGLCPFHSDKNPSFYVSPSKNICKCFSCGEGGDPVNFLMKHEQMNYLEALRWLARKYGIEIQEKEQTDAERQAQTAREGMMNLNDFAMRTFESDLYNTDEGRNIGLTYFRERGLQDETIRLFHLGYALEAKDDFARRALAQGHRREYLLDPTETRREGVGLCYGDDPSRMPVCRFAGRVIFPFMSLSGKPLAFGGRILQRVDHAFKKYVNSPESMVYHKGNLLYGIFQAKGEMAKQDKCYIVEGNVDVLSMSQAGFRNVVASAGTALTTSQIRLIQRFTRNVTLMFDGDDAGIRASLKTIDLLLLEGMNVKLLLLPDGHDPDSFCRQHTMEELQRYFAAHEQDFIAYKTQMLLQDSASDPLKRAQVLQNLVQSIALIADPIMRSLYIRETSQRLHVAEEALMQALRTQRQSNYVAELRRWETDQRREEYLRQQEELKAARELSEGGGATPGSDQAGQNTGDAGQNASGQNPNNAADAGMNLQGPGGGVPTGTGIPTGGGASTGSGVSTGTVTTPKAPERAPLLTDRYECGIIRLLVRAGGNYITLRWCDETGAPQEEQWRVVDFVGSELTADGIVFQHPLYARMLQMAYDASADPSVTFDSVRFFTRIDDSEVRQKALDLIDDKYEAISGVENNESLNDLVPRSILELKEAICRTEMNDLHRQLRNPGCDYRAVMQRLTELQAIKKDLDKSLGERIITGG